MQFSKPRGPHTIAPRAARVLAVMGVACAFGCSGAPATAPGLGFEAAAGVSGRPDEGRGGSSAPGGVPGHGGISAAGGSAATGGAAASLGAGGLEGSGGALAGGVGGGAGAFGGVAGGGAEATGGRVGGGTAAAAGHLGSSAAAGASGHSVGGVSGLGGSAGMAPARFTQVTTYLQGYCATSTACHGTGAKEVVLRGTTVYDTLMGLTVGRCSNRPMVVAGDPAGSAFYGMLNGGCGSYRMPPACTAAPCSTAENLALVESWIANGALND